MYENDSFRKRLKAEFERFNALQSARFPRDETVCVDIHCHDHNSDVPDERMGRMLRLPETWAGTEDVLRTASKNRTHPLTITNHNNARSCFELQDKGKDVLVGAEFTCYMPEFDVRFHTLTYGFTPEQEVYLNQYRRNIYRFLDYTTDNDIVTVLAHPLFCYKKNGVPPLRFLEKATLMFDNFEVINGQRDAWQNLLIAAWLDSLDEERVLEISRRENLNPRTFCKRPVDKGMTGGSDCHMALFVGTAGTRFYIPELESRKGQLSMSALVLDSLKEGLMAPFGMFASEEKLTTAVLDYFCQAVLYMKDPGLIRLLLHKGETVEKLLALGIANGVMELQRHNYTTKFLGSFHSALHGKRPGFLLRRRVAKHYRPLVDELDSIAKSRKKGPDAFEQSLLNALPRMFNCLDKLLAGRVVTKIGPHRERLAPASERPFDFIEKMEMPAYLRTLFSGAVHASGRRDSDTCFELLDGLPFPALLSVVLAGAHFVSAGAMFQSRALLDELSSRLGKLKHPNRIMWLTDTFQDKNGVSRTLNLMRDEVERRGLPIDFVVVSETPIDLKNVISLKPLAEFETPYYKGQTISLPDMVELHKLFVEGAYDRVICSTEGPMGLMALYLKYAFSVPAFFYLHTDWLTFAKRTMGLSGASLDRVRRVARAFYRRFDGMFVLNSDQAQSVQEDFDIPKERVFRTDHWVKARFRPLPVDKAQLLPGVNASAPLLIYAGRVSEEKGVMSLPEIVAAVRQVIPEARLLVCGDGPLLERLKGAVPDGIYPGWVDDGTLVKMFSVSDVMLFPSMFDTYGNVVIEAQACGVPVIAYGVKGPKDIVHHGKSGFLVDTPEEMAERVISVLRTPSLRMTLRKGALECATAHQPIPIVDALIKDVGLPVQTGDADAVFKERSVDTHVKAG